MKFGVYHARQTCHLCGADRSVAPLQCPMGTKHIWQTALVETEAPATKRKRRTMYEWIIWACMGAIGIVICAGIASVGDW